MSLYNVFGELNQAITYLSADKTDTREIKILVRAMRDDITDYIIEFRKSYPHIAFRIALDFGETDFDILIVEEEGIQGSIEDPDMEKINYEKEKDKELSKKYV